MSLVCYDLCSPHPFRLAPWTYSLTPYILFDFMGQIVHPFQRIVISFKSLKNLTIIRRLEPQTFGIPGKRYTSCATLG